MHTALRWWRVVECGCSLQDIPCFFFLIAFCYRGAPGYICYIDLYPRPRARCSVVCQVFTDGPPPAPTRVARAQRVRVSLDESPPRRVRRRWSRIVTSFPRVLRTLTRHQSTPAGGVDVPPGPRICPSVPTHVARAQTRPK
eukprot:1698587-Prymnesium_polylepis.1